VNYRLFINQIAPLLISVLAITVGVTWGVREEWSNNYHAADASVYSSAIQSNTLLGISSDSNEQIAKMWMQISEDYRAASIYMSLATGHQMMSILLYSISFCFSLNPQTAKKDPDNTDRLKTVACITYFAMGTLFLVFSMIPVAYKYDYSYVSPGSIPYFDNFSWCQADLFPSPMLPIPPLISPSGLQPSGFVQGLYLQYPKLGNYLDSLPTHLEIERLQSASGFRDNSISCQGPQVVLFLLIMLIPVVLIVSLGVLSAKKAK